MNCSKCGKHILEGQSYECISLSTESYKGESITVEDACFLIIRCEDCGTKDILKILNPLIPDLEITEIPEEVLSILG